MGVQGLWELLAPVGRRVSVETLAGKRLAVDASIWIVQFIKAIRDDRSGDALRHAHLLGFLRRIAKLLFLRARPVFVFDGATPALKRRTLAARRRLRDQARSKIRKTAEKLLLNHLKTKRLEELAAEIRRTDPKTNSKGKQVAHDGHDGAAAPNQQSLDELLAASLAAEEESKLGGGGKGGNFAEQEADGDDDEEMIYPTTMDGGIDPTVLASLPPSMQLDLLVQMRERLMADNRQRYQKIKKAPSKFSELQIQSYLKTVAFRREIDEVQKCATGRGLGGVQTSRIASEANKEFIFSSSFTGDKQKLTSAGIGRNGDTDHNASKNRGSLTSSSCSIGRSNSAAGSSSIAKSPKDFGPGVETYYDDRGLVRVSRVRGLGIHMTRDLQRNLDLMKEYEEEKFGENIGNKVHDTSKVFSGSTFSAKASACSEENQDLISENRSISSRGDTAHGFDEPSVVGNKAVIEVSFVEDDSERKDTVDELFLHLVSGSSTIKPVTEGTFLDSNIDDSESDSIWEEGVVEENTITPNERNKQNDLISAEQIHPEDDEVDWEEGVCRTPGVVSDSQGKHENALSIGLLEEEADIQEAIRRSLEDFERPKSSGILPDDPNTELTCGGKESIQSMEVSAKERNVGSTHMPLDTHPVSSRSPCIGQDRLGQLYYPCKKNTGQTENDPENHLSSHAGYRSDGESSLNDETNKGLLVSSHNLKTQSVVDDGSLGTLQTPTAKSVQARLEEGSMDSFKQGEDETLLMEPTEAFVGLSANVNLEANCTSLDKAPDTVVTDVHLQDLQDSELSLVSRRSSESAFCQEKSVVKVAVDIDRENKQNLAIKNAISTSGESSFGCESTIQESFTKEVSESALDEEISLLRQERKDLGDEQKKLERNAESVSSEMFAECQELLQMFGLPYIIAPMEAEAQCAYMEMKNLVDGVVTDDSDVFLFGARSVYKNIFDDRKYVETYFMKDIESELGLTREKLIRMAMLLGSDYTEGVSGIGIVNAIEVVHAFPEEDGLGKFKEWIESPDPSILGKLKTKSCKASNNNADGTGNNVEESVCEGNISRQAKDQPDANDGSKIKEIFMDKHRNVSKNWHIPSSFPSASVISAYISPQVDQSTESFSWGKPDLFLLRKLCWEKFGWSNQKADELLVPVLKEYNKHETQLRLEAFYTFNERFAKIRSQRIKKAVKGITGTSSSELINNPVQELSKSRTKGRLCSSGPKESKPEVRSDGTNVRGRKVSKPSRQENTEIKVTQTDGGAELHTSFQVGGIGKSGLHADVQGRGRGRGRGGRTVRGRGRGRGRKRGRGQEEADFDSTEFAEASSSDESMHSDELGKVVKFPDKKPESRRSTRQRKHVLYAEGEVDVDEVCCSSIPIDGTVSSETEEETSEIWGEVMPGDASGDQVVKQSHLEERCSQDYLLSGGGFCEDESDDLGVGGQPVASPMRDSVGPLEEQTQIAGSLPGHGDLNSSCNELNQQPVLQTCSPLEHGPGEQGPKPGLRAMPSLKRKRKT